MEIKVTLNRGAVKPEYATDGSAGADLRVYPGGECEIKPGETVKLPTGVSLEIPEGYVGLIYARSSLAVKKGLALANSVGVIDSDYRGELSLTLRNITDKVVTVADGERLAQIVITPFVRGIFTESEKLNDTERGAGGFGSTGNT